MYIRLFKIALFAIHLTLVNNLFAQGLLFQGNDKLISERTSYSVFFTEQPTFQSATTLNFELSILKLNTFGYICYVKDVASGNFYSLTLSNKDDRVFLNLNANGRKKLATIPFLKSELGNRRWKKVSIKFDISRKSIALTTDNSNTVSFGENFNINFTPQIIFGKHDNIVDVPQFAIRNLDISGGEKRFRFNLNEFAGQEVYDEDGEIYGKVENPVWLINDAYHWKLKYKWYSKKVATVNFQAKAQNFVMSNADSIVFYDLRLNKPEVKPYVNEFTLPARLGMSCLDSIRNRLIIYEVNDFPQNKTSISYLQLDSLKWNDISQKQLDQQKHHHTVFFDYPNNSFILFGGFGNNKYSNDFWQFDLRKNQWQLLKYTGDKIQPRFLCGHTAIDSVSSIIFGGIGNETGELSLGKLYFYDCYRVNHNQKTITKLWSNFVDANGKIPARNMVLSDDKKSFYALCYAEYLPNTYLKLYQFDLATGKFEILGDSIPMNSERIETNANLHYNAPTKELYCTTQEFNPDGSSVIRILSISCPPVSGTFFTKPEIFRINWWLIISTGIIVLGFVTGIAFYLLRKKKASLAGVTIQNNIPPTEEDFNIDHPVRTNSVYIFGNFKAFDKDGREIAYMFSPKIKQLFLYIFLNHVKYPEGISTAAIYQNVWPDKTPDKAKNIKGVILKQLRDILKDFEGIELLSKLGGLQMRITPDFYCDYFEFLDNLQKVGLKANNDEEINQILKLISKGPFLNDLNQECFDGLKTGFEDKLYSILYPLLEESFRQNNYLKVIKISKILNRVDDQNQFVLHHEIHAYLNIQRVDLAKKRYNTYILTFSRDNNEEYPVTYQQIIGSKHPSYLKFKD